MAQVIVQFTDQAETTICGSFAVTQTALPDMGAVEDTDPRYTAFLLGTPSQQLAAKAAAGCAIVSSATPDLAGTYALDPAARANIAAEAQFISTFSEFTTQQPTLPWFDLAGTPHEFAETADFLSFAKAMAVYFTALNVAAASGQTPIPWPAQPVTIV